LRRALPETSIIEEGKFFIYLLIIFLYIIEMIQILQKEAVLPRAEKVPSGFLNSRL
jgi:hypothetical protein